MTKPKEASGIYGIFNIENGKVYIGHSSHIKNRWYEHKRVLSNGKHVNPHLQSAWNKYGSQAFQFRMIEELSGSTLPAREMEWISFLKTTDMDKGYNLTRGGDGVEMTPSTRKKISLKHKGKKLSSEHKKKLSIAHMGKTLTPEHKDKMSKSRMGHICDKETREKISKANRGENNYFYGKKRSEEYCLTLSRAQKGRVVSPETRDKISKAHIGMKHTPETRAKMSKVKTGTTPWNKGMKMKDYKKGDYHNAKVRIEV